MKISTSNSSIQNKLDTVTVMPYLCIIQQTLTGNPGQNGKVDKVSSVTEIKASVARVQKGKQTRCNEPFKQGISGDGACASLGGFQS